MATLTPLVWLITGCSAGFGRSLTLLVLKAGHHVIATSRTPSKTPSLVKHVEELGGIWLPLDMTADKESMQKVVEEGTRKFGRVDVLVNNAGISILGALEDFRCVFLFCVCGLGEGGREWD
jgi:NADP-dependent 3-hydroxy acid dehydrogenase YdfG